jgi:hypothetical protein
MSFDLLRMQPHPNRQSEEEVMVLIKKGSKRAKDSSVDMTQFRIQIYLLDAVKKKPDGFQVVNFSASPRFDVVADHAERSVTFTLGEMGALLPVELRGGGLGSYIMSELVKWAKSSVPDYGVVPVKVFTPPDERGDTMQRNKTFLAKMGFTLYSSEAGSQVGLFGVTSQVGSLKVHANTQKLERVDLPGWLNDLTAERAAMGNQMEEEIVNARVFKEELQRQKSSDKGRLSFWAGLFLGLVVGAVAAGFLSAA